MKTSESIVYPMVSLFEAVDLPFHSNLLKALPIFASKSKSSLTLSEDRLCATLSLACQKLGKRRMGVFYEYTT